MVTRNFRELRDALVADPRRVALLAEAKQRGDAEVAAYDVSLTQLRHARALTQEQLARSLAVSQVQVSGIENQTDLYLSTLRSYLEAMGAQLELAVVFDDERFVISLPDLIASDQVGDPAGGTVVAPSTRERSLRPKKSPWHGHKVSSAQAGQKAKGSEFVRKTAPP